MQLNFSIESKYHTKKFSLILKQKNKIKNKVFKAMEIAKANNINIICFPELSFDKEWINEIIKRYRDMIIIGGSYYDDGFNICPIIVNGVCFSPLYKKIEPSPYENPKSTGHGMKSGDKLFIFQTKYGRFSVLTCSDYTPKHISLICEYEAGSSKGVDFIINPRYEQNMLKHQDRCNVDSREYDICILQVNKAPEGEKFGKSCIIAKEHNILLQKYKDENIKPNDNINYKLCQAEGEMLMIVDLNIKEAPTIDITTNYPGRISTSKERWYKYENECWLPLST